MVSIGEVIDRIVELLPIPKTIFEGTWFIIGWMAGKAFGEKFDEEILDQIPDTDKYKFIKRFVGRILHFIHHAWIGLLGVVYFGVAPVAQSINLPVYIPVIPCAEAFWFFLGLALEDIAFHTRASLSNGFLRKIADAFSPKGSK